MANELILDDDISQALIKVEQQLDLTEQLYQQYMKEGDVCFAIFKEAISIIMKKMNISKTKAKDMLKTLHLNKIKITKL